MLQKVKMCTLWNGYTPERPLLRLEPQAPIKQEILEKSWDSAGGRESGVAYEVQNNASAQSRKEGDGELLRC